MKEYGKDLIFMKKVLLTGFEPFGGEKINPALEIIKELAAAKIEGVVLHTAQIPVVCKKSIIALEEKIDALSPDIVICVGQAGGRSEITIERVAINVDDYRIADNEGNKPIDVPVIEKAPAAYFSTLPLKSIVKGLRKAAIPASVSNTAGTFVCNHLFFGLMHKLSASPKKVRGGFIHIPFLPEQVIDKPNTASMSLSMMIKAIKIAIEISIERKEDLQIAGGTIC